MVVDDYKSFYDGLGNASVAPKNHQIISVSDMQPRAGIVEPPDPEVGTWAGDKYYGGFGATQIYEVDYWTLRARSAQLYRENLYCRGLIRRLVTNIINTGISVESTPNEAILGLPEDSLQEWSENVETLFEIWANNPLLCDFRGKSTFWQLQRASKSESLVEGDMLVTVPISATTGLPQIHLINGSLVQTPLRDIPEGKTIEHGVELDKDGRHVAYWVDQDDGTSKRIPAWGPKSKRRVAWLIYGCDKRYDDVRGEPLLSLVLQQTKELDRNRDAVLRKATINNILAMVVEKELPTPGSRPVTGMGIQRTEVTANDTTNSNRKFSVSESVPGVYVDELAPGEKIKVHSNQANDINFGAFEESILNAIAWAHEIPPSILKLMFSSNYSASQGESNELKLYLNKDRSNDADQFYKLVYQEYFISSVLLKKIEARGFLEAWRDPTKYDIFGAWIASDWSGAIKPTVDPVKQVNGYILMVEHGWITNARASKELTGTKYSKNIRRLRSENAQKAEINAVFVDDTSETDDTTASVIDLELVNANADR